MEVIQQLAAVALVLALLGGALWALRRRGFAGVAPCWKPAGRRMESLERLSLGPQHALHLVRVGEAELLLAVSPSGCALLTSLARPSTEVAR
jgi:flagellar biosynthetic protein FliO